MNFAEECLREEPAVRDLKKQKEERKKQVVTPV